MNFELLAELLFPNITNTPDYYEDKYPKRNLNKKDIVVRFAPSPTGFIHMGSLYVASLNRLLVNQNHGIYYLRIEDTDHKREVKGGIKLIQEALDYFSISFDESPSKGGEYGPYIQSERKVIYQTYIKDLIKKGLAYPCFCTEAELESIRESQVSSKSKLGYYGKWAMDRNLTFDEIQQRVNNGKSYVIRLKTPKIINEKIECNDMIKGNIYFPTNDIDVVLLKSDGLPTYHFAHVIDDYLMRTTHVIRGDEWLSSLPIHLQLFSMLGFELPKYVHISPLTKKEGNSIRKLSKRKDPESAISYYQEKGIPIEALKIYFANITNSNFEQWYSQNQRAPLTDFTFTFNKMPVGGTLFDINKLKNICRQYFSLESALDIYLESLDYFKTYDNSFYEILLKNKEYVISILNIEKDRPRPRKDIACYKDIKDENWYMFDELFYSNVSYLNLKDETTYDYNILVSYLSNYFDINDNEVEWYDRTKSLAVHFGYAPDVKSYKENPNNYKGHIGDICELIRVAITGEKQTPSLYEIQQILGFDRIKARIDNFKNFF